MHEQTDLTFISYPELTATLEELLFGEMMLEKRISSIQFASLVAYGGKDLRIMDLPNHMWFGLLETLH